MEIDIRKRLRLFDAINHYVELVALGTLVVRRLAVSARPVQPDFLSLIDEINEYANKLKSIPFDRSPQEPERCN